MIRIYVAAIFLSLVGLPSVASADNELLSTETSVKKKKKSTKSKITKTPDSASKDDAPEKNLKKKSENLRPEKPISLNLNYTPLSDYLLQYGATVGYALNKDLETSFIILSGSQDFKDKVGEIEGATVTAADGSAMMFSVNGRYFFGNSFSVFGGLGYRTATINMGVKTNTTLISVDSTVTATNIIMFLGLGNHWIFENGLTIGCDWAAMSIPITSSSSYTQTTTGLSSNEAEDIEKSSADLGVKISKINAISLLIGNIGYRF